MRITVLFPFVFATGCIGHADLMLPHPLTGHALSPQESEIEKPQGYVETNNGLPLGTLTQRAKLTKLDDQQACFAVNLHSLDAEHANLRALKTVLKAQPTGAKVEGATVTDARADSRVYEGLVPHQEPSGTEEYCAQRDSRTNVCNSWRTRTLYTTTMIPGPVTVYSGSANVCFAHGGIVNEKSQRVILDLHKITMVGFLPQKVGIDFRWGFTGAVTDKDEKGAHKREKPVSASAKVDVEAEDKALDAQMEKAMNEKSAPVTGDASVRKRKRPVKRAPVSQARRTES